MPPIFMGPIPPGPRVINQSVTIKQSGGGFAQFLMGLFGGLRGAAMPGMMYPTATVPYFPVYTTPSVFMQNPMMPYPMMQYPAMNQMSPYAYLNQQQVQQLPDNSSEAPSTEMQNLETFFKDKGYIICPEEDGNYTVTDKDGNLLASGSYEEVRDRLFEINKEAIEEAEDVEDSEDADDEDDVDEVTAPRTQKVPSDWHKASADGYRYLKSVDVSAVNREAKKEGQSAARYLVSHLFLPSRGLYGCLSNSQINNLTNKLVSFNKDCFNEDGSFKEEFSVDNLALPNTTWVMKHIVRYAGMENMTMKQLKELVKTHMSNSNPYLRTEEDKRKGNTQFCANIAAQNNCRETQVKDVYYNDKTRTHFYLYDESERDENGKVIKERYRMVALPEVKFVAADGRWKDSHGESHRYEELIALAEGKHDVIDTNENRDNGGYVPDDDGMADTTDVFKENDEY